MIKVAVISSTAGSVMNAVLGLPYMSQRICTVLSDRECGAVKVAKDRNIPVQQCITDDALHFSNQLGEFFLGNPHDLVVSFYTKIFRGVLLEQLEGKFVNFHPSILPACPGIDGFGDTIRSGSRFIGATAHFIDPGVDTGYPVIQSARPYNLDISRADNRHAIFVAQCKMFIQVVQWYEEGRINTDSTGRPHIDMTCYQVGEFSPNLDSKYAIDFFTLRCNGV